MRCLVYIATLLLVLCALPVQALRAQTSSDFQPFQDIRVLHDVRQGGVRGVAVYFDLDLGSRVSKDSSAAISVTAWLINAQSQSVMALPDAVGYQGWGGFFRDSISLRVPPSVSLVKDEALFIPYHALSLDPGPHELSLRLLITYKGMSRISVENTQTRFLLNMPPQRLYRLQLTQLLAFDTDMSGETWDYALLSPREIYPELEWSLRRGSQTIFQSERTRNALQYVIDPQKDLTKMFSLVEGDSVFLIVQDFDLLSFSDHIGTVPIAPSPSSSPAPAIKRISGAYGRIKEIEFDLVTAEMPKFQLQNFKLDAPTRVQGVLGYRLDFDYEVVHWRRDAPIQVALEHLNIGRFSPAKYVRMLQGPALVEREGLLSIHAPKGHLQIFIPWYGLPDNTELIRLAPTVVFADGSRFTLGWHSARLDPAMVETADFEFGQLKITPDSAEGLQGLHISCEYALAANYFKDLATAKVFLKPSILGPDGPIPMESIYLRSPQGHWQLMSSVHEVLPAADTGQVEFFLPYWLISATGIGELEMGFVGLLRHENREQVLGSRHHLVDTEIPPIQVYQFQVREFSCKGDMLPEAGMGLWWRLRVGKETRYSSRVILDDTSPQWKAQDEALLKLGSQDRFSIELIRRNAAGKDELVATWIGTAGQLPTLGGKTGVLKLQGIKRLSFRIEKENR